VRRFAASLLTGLGLLAATAAWGAFAASSAAFDPESSERVADVLVEQPAVRDAIAKALGKALSSDLPGGVQISGAEVDSVARRVADDPRTAAVLRTAIVGAHRRIVGNGAGPVQLETGLVAQAGRDALIGVHPELAASLSAVPLKLELPTDKLPNLTPLRGHLGRVGRLGVLLATWLLSAAMLVASDGPWVLRRAGRWAVGVGLSSLATTWLLPSLVSRVEAPQVAMMGALAVALAGRVVVPAVILLAAGAGAMVVARAWRTATARSAVPPHSPA